MSDSLFISTHFARCESLPTTKVTPACPQDEDKICQSSLVAFRRLWFTVKQKLAEKHKQTKRALMDSVSVLISRFKATARAPPSSLEEDKVAN